MEAAAKRVKLFHDFPPERPYHLALSADIKFQTPRNFWHQHPALQYTTLLSDADRGILLTRAHYDICEDPPVVTAHATGTVGGGAKQIGQAHAVAELKKVAGKKISIKDYQKQKRAPTSQEADGPGKDAGAQRANPVKQDDARSSQDLKVNGVSPHTNGTSSHVGAGAQESRPDRAVSPKRKATKVEVGHAKNTIDERDDISRPAKKAKHDDESDGLSEHKDLKGVRYNKDHKSEHADSGRLPARPSQSKVDKSLDSSSQEMKKIGHQRETNGERPKSVVNGDKAKHPEHDETFLRKKEAIKKDKVPPLLSPLRLLLEEADSKHGHKQADSKTAMSADARRKDKSYKVPPLLSPTLPPHVEEELARRQQTPVKGEPGRSTSSTTMGKTARAQSDDDSDSTEQESPKTRIVILKYRKTSAKRVLGLLALPPASERQAQKMERSLSGQHTPIVKKRPRVDQVQPEASPHSFATKRLKAAEGLLGKAPSTPSGSAGTPSHTIPGTSRSHTSRPDTSHTPSTRDGEVRPGTARGSSQSKVIELQKQQRDYSAIGRKLKHERDALSSRRRTSQEPHSSNSNGNGHSNNSKDKTTSLSDADEKKCLLLCMEMILAYMISFKADNEARELERKPWNPAAWESLQPHFSPVTSNARRWPALYALAQQLQGVCLNETQLSYANTGSAAMTSSAVANMLKNAKTYQSAWTTAHEVLARVKDEQMKTPLMGPWTTPREAVAQALHVVKRWARSEKVDWKPELVLPS